MIKCIIYAIILVYVICFVFQKAMERNYVQKRYYGQ